MPTTITNMILTVTSVFYNLTRFASSTDDNANDASTVTATFNTDGSVTITNSAGDSSTSDFTHWHNLGTSAGIGNSRWAKKTLVSGDVTSGTLGTSITSLDTTRTITISTVAAEQRSGVYLIEIYNDAGGTTKVGQISLTLTANP
jgi:hypothetical protein